MTNTASWSLDTSINPPEVTDQDGWSEISRFAMRTSVTHGYEPSFAADVAQEVCVKLFVKNPTWKMGHAKAFIRVAVANQEKDQLRARDRRSEREDQVFADSESEFEMHLDQDMADTELRYAAAETLDETDFAVFVMRYDLDFTHAEIARELGCSRQAVGKRLVRIHNTLIELFEDRRWSALRIDLENPDNHNF